MIDNEPTPVPFWVPEKVFENQTILIVGGGPSIDEIDLNDVNGKRFIVVNSSCRKLRPIATENDWLYFSDNSWSERFEDLIRNWPGIKATSNRNVKMRLKELVYRIDLEWIIESLKVNSTHVYNSSGHAAACLAATLGAKRIVLIGFECMLIDGKSHGHKDYTQGDISTFNSRYIPSWEALSIIFKEYNIQVINSTPTSMVTCFPYLPLGEAVR